MLNEGHLTMLNTPARRSRSIAQMLMAARCATALLGGYAAASGLASLLARLLPMSRAEATTWGMIVSFLIFAVLSLWAFHERRLARVVGIIWGAAAVSAAGVLLLGPRL